jgi:hypothetical protein
MSKSVETPNKFRERLPMSGVRDELACLDF